MFLGLLTPFKFGRRGSLLGTSGEKLERLGFVPEVHLCFRLALIGEKGKGETSIFDCIGYGNLLWILGDKNLNEAFLVWFL